MKYVLVGFLTVKCVIVYGIGMGTHTHWRIAMQDYLQRKKASDPFASKPNYQLSTFCYMLCIVSSQTSVLAPVTATAI